MSMVEVPVAPSHTPALRTRGVNYSFGEGEARSQVLFDVDLAIEPGEVVIMTGPSGSGKTTLLTLIGALRHVQDGSVQVLGRELAEMSAPSQVRLRREIGFIFQHHNLFSSLSAIENVRMASTLQVEPREPSGNEGEPAAELLGRLGLSDRLHHLPSQLSGGQRQRVAIARALVNRPRLVLADEPTAALDATTGEAVMTMLHQLADGPTRSTILIVTHDQRLIDRADRIVNMVAGKIVSNVRPAMAVRICKALSQTKELAGIGESTLARVADRMSVEYRPRGDVIVREGDHGDRAYVIGQGVAKAYKGDSTPRELTVGERFGRITAISNMLIDETVEALTDLEIYWITEDDTRQILESDKNLEERLRRHYMSRQ